MSKGHRDGQVGAVMTIQVYLVLSHLYAFFYIMLAKEREHLYTILHTFIWYLGTEEVILAKSEKVKTIGASREQRLFESGKCSGHESKVARFSK